LTLAYVSLGSNLGDRGAYLRLGLAIVAGSDVARVSAVYETDPVGGVDQDDFWNVVVEIETSATPHELLARCREAEARAERVREVRWGPRTLDCDVVLVGDLVVDEPDLTVPHPRMWERRFVLVPLQELRPDLVSSAQLATAEGDVRRLATLSDVAQ
jgi:2-amino-4-hydroxy-6-hydroxymethyldihydropteridine diphosphokinase